MKTSPAAWRIGYGNIRGAELLSSPLKDNRILGNAHHAREDLKFASTWGVLHKIQNI